MHGIYRDRQREIKRGQTSLRSSVLPRSIVSLSLDSRNRNVWTNYFQASFSSLRRFNQSLTLSLSSKKKEKEEDLNKPRGNVQFSRLDRISSLPFCLSPRALPDCENVRGGIQLAISSRSAIVPNEFVQFNALYAPIRAECDYNSRKYGGAPTLFTVPDSFRIRHSLSTLIDFAPRLVYIYLEYNRARFSSTSRYEEAVVRFPGEGARERSIQTRTVYTIHFGFPNDKCTAREEHNCPSDNKRLSLPLAPQEPGWILKRRLIKEPATLRIHWRNNVPRCKRPGYVSYQLVYWLAARCIIYSKFLASLSYQFSI